MILIPPPPLPLSFWYTQPCLCVSSDIVDVHINQCFVLATCISDRTLVEGAAQETGEVLQREIKYP